MLIIEQTAKEFQDIFGDVVEILQHHSNYSFEEEEETQTTMHFQKALCNRALLQKEKAPLNEDTPRSSLSL